MENQTQNNASTTPPTATENGTSATHEVSSTTQAVEPTKRSLRVLTWKKIQDNKCGVGFNAIFNRVPGFVDSDKAATLLTETDEFKKSQNVKVNIDRALHAVKLQTLLSGKTLYLPATRESSAIFLRVDIPTDSTDDQKKDILQTQDVQQHRTPITLENKLKLDLIVVGSVVVSREGYRIGRGNGFNDLDLGVLAEIGSITPETVIATMVHDLQVVDTLPANLFQKHDMPIDLIVTPTEVIRVSKRLQRPKGVFWELLSERRLKIVPVLQALKENEEKAGKVIALKETDTDIEQNHNTRNRRRGPMNRRQGRRNPRRTNSQTDNEHQGEVNQPRRNQRQGQGQGNRRFTNRRRRPTKSEGDQSGVEGKSQERKATGGNNEKRRRPRKNFLTRDFSVKLSEIPRIVRVKDLKAELRKREINPIALSWKGAVGTCTLHFGNRNGTPSTEEHIDKVMKSLGDLSLTVVANGEKDGGDDGTENGSVGQAAPQTKTVNVKVELLQRLPRKGEDGGDREGAPQTNGDVAAGGDAGARVESVDTTTV